jgi:hypothetical protein
VPAGEEVRNPALRDRAGRDRHWRCQDGLALHPPHFPYRALFADSRRPAAYRPADTASDEASLQILLPPMGHGDAQGSARTLCHTGCEPEVSAGAGIVIARSP